MIFSITTILLFGSLPVFPQKQAKQFQHGAVAADATPCSTIGAGVLRSNGSAVDAWIASVICLGVYHPMSSGLGGGGVALVYSKEKQQFFSYDFFGVAPEAVYKANLEERFKNEPKSSMYGMSMRINIKTIFAYKSMEYLYQLLRSRHLFVVLFH